MNRYTKEQHIVIVRTHFKFGESLAEAVRGMSGILDIQNSLHETIVRKLTKGNWFGYGLTTSTTSSSCVASENIAVNSDSINENPGTSTHHCFQ